MGCSKVSQDLVNQDIAYRHNDVSSAMHQYLILAPLRNKFAPICIKITYPELQ